MSNVISAIKGMNDIYPGATELFLDTTVWDHIADTARRVLGSYGYRLVQLPVVEDTTLFARGIGDETDVVSKEMYTFSDRAERSLTLRPEGTAGAVRAYIEHNLARGESVQRWWYWGPMFRAERPQKGRYRQFYQIGAEFFGVSSSAADAEVLEMLWHFCRSLGLEGIQIKLNTLGDRASRVAFRTALTSYFNSKAPELCESCRARISINPLRILDCKRESCRAVASQAPPIDDTLSDVSRQHFAQVCQLLSDRQVPFVRDRMLVRGLDYYTGTTFEFTTSMLGSQDAVLGGGRYDELVELLGGPPTPAIGFAAGVERLALLIADKLDRSKDGPDLYIAPFSGFEGKALDLAGNLRRTSNVKVEVDLSEAKVKNQLKRALKVGARFFLALGEQEFSTQQGILKDLRKTLEIPTNLDNQSLAQRVVRSLEEHEK